MIGLYQQPVMRPIADIGILVEFGDSIDAEVHARVLNFDEAVQQASITGLTELTPSYASVFVGYDPLSTDYDTVCKALTRELDSSLSRSDNHSLWTVPVCYAERYAPDLPEVEDRLGIPAKEIINAHISGSYTVYMYGFAPGCAYLGGVPESIHLPRKQAPVMHVPQGSVIIAGPQAIITTIDMPSGWWIIGRTAFTPLQDDPARPFLFNIGDTVEFVSVDEAEFAAHSGHSE